MARMHLFEFEDQKWFPGFLRMYVTDFLHFLSIKAGVFKNVIPMMVENLVRLNTTTIIDLGSGSGGGLVGLYPELQKSIPAIRITLTDFYPNQKVIKRTENSAPGITYEASSVDARNVPTGLKGMRTMFLSFHHFKPADARSILQNVVDANSAIMIFESQERSFPSLLAMVLSPISVFFTTPFIRPFSLVRILFTYVIPVIPLVVLWDGIVSSLRTYSIAEMNALIDSLEGKDRYEWKTGKIKSGPAQVFYMCAVPKIN